MKAQGCLADHADLLDRPEHRSIERQPLPRRRDAVVARLPRPRRQYQDHHEHFTGPAGFTGATSHRYRQGSS